MVIDRDREYQQIRKDYESQVNEIRKHFEL